MSAKQEQSNIRRVPIKRADNLKALILRLLAGIILILSILISCSLEYAAQTIVVARYGISDYSYVTWEVFAMAVGVLLVGLVVSTALLLIAFKFERESSLRRHRIIQRGGWKEGPC